MTFQGWKHVIITWNQELYYNHSLMQGIFVIVIRNVFLIAIMNVKAELHVHKY